MISSNKKKPYSHLCKQRRTHRTELVDGFGVPVGIKNTHALGVFTSLRISINFPAVCQELLQIFYLNLDPRRVPYRFATVASVICASSCQATPLRLSATTFNILSASGFLHGHAPQFIIAATIFLLADFGGSKYATIDSETGQYGPGKLVQ